LPLPEPPAGLGAGDGREPEEGDGSGGGEGVGAGAGCGRGGEACGAGDEAGGVETGLETGGGGETRGAGALEPPPGAARLTLRGAGLATDRGAPVAAALLEARAFVTVGGRDFGRGRALAADFALRDAPALRAALGCGEGVRTGARAAAWGPCSGVTPASAVALAGRFPAVEDSELTTTALAAAIAGTVSASATRRLARGRR
jgi:hypothetical protein